MAELLRSVPSGLKLVLSTPSQGNDDFSFSAGQVVVFEVKNANVLGTTFTITSVRTALREPGFWRTLLGNTYAMTEEASAIILPLTTMCFKFSCFGAEPMSWQFKTSTDSDACQTYIKVWSTWVRGMKPNG